MSLTRTGLDPRDMLEALQAFADGSVAHHVATEMAVEAQRLVRATFAESKAPSGRRWLPLKKPRPGGRVLVKTGKLAAIAAMYSVDEHGFVFERVDTSSAFYGRYHQGEGFRLPRLPRRPFYPDEAGPLPVGWWIGLGSAAERAVADFVPR